MAERGRPFERKRTDEQPLTPAELKVLRLVGDGLTNAQVAGRLGLSIETVKAHMKSISMELGARTRAHAFAIAWRRRLVE